MGLRYFTLLLLVFALGATPPKRTAGFIDLPRLVAAHPLHAVLAGYDREIAALRSTQNLPGLRDPGATARTAASAQQREAGAAQAIVGAIAARDPNYDRVRERRALAALNALGRGGPGAMSEYTDALVRETDASLAAFSSATAQRSARAYAARAQQLREQELTLAFDLEREDAGRRLALRVKLDELHLSAPARAKLEAQLAALGARELHAITILRARDAETLAAYRRQLVDEGAAANAAMAAQLRSKAVANFAVRRRVAESGASAVPRAELPGRLAAFSASYARPAATDAVESGVRTAGTDLSQRFTALGDVDRRSQREVAAQIATLQGDRIALYRAIVAQILQTANRIAEQRGLTRVELTGTRPNASVDLTGAVKASIR